LEETIRSVLLQSHSNIEYLVYDGGSQDQSVEIIKHYGKRIDYWQSTPDKGQAHAINKGLKRASGDIVAWLNSDDLYYPETLSHVAIFFSQNPDTAVVFGNAVFIDESSLPAGFYQGKNFCFFRKLMYWLSWDIPQPTVFVRRSILSDVGYLDESYNYSLDYEWLLRIAKNYRMQHLDEVLAGYRLHTESKTGTWENNKSKFHRECAKAVRTYAPDKSLRGILLATLRRSHQIFRLLHGKTDGNRNKSFSR
jgi:glycosyltransferase involved in cell wall biosynthesis